MATHTITAFFFEGGGRTLSPSSLSVAKNDTIIFRYESWLSIGSATITNLSSSIFEDASNVVVAHGGSVIREIRLDAAITTNTIFWETENCVISVVASTSRVYPFGWETKQLQPKNTLVESDDWVTIRWDGTQGSTGIVVSGDGNPELYMERAGVWGTSFAPIIEGDRFKIRLTTSSQFGTARTATAKAGTSNTEGTFTVVTEYDPDSGETLYIPVSSPPISTADVEDHFGSRRLEFWGGAGDMLLSEYVRGGEFVPDITANRDKTPPVPDSLPMSLLSLVGSATSLYWTVKPPDYVESANTQSGVVTLGKQWNAGDPTGFDVGYGEYMITTCEIRITQQIIDNGYGGNLAGSAEAGLGVWAPAISNRWFKIEQTTSGTPFEMIHEGIFTVEIRHPDFRSQVLVETCRYQLAFFGV